MAGFPKASHIQTARSVISHLHTSSHCRMSRNAIGSGVWTLGSNSAILTNSNVYCESRDPSWSFPMWPDLPKPSTYAHHGKEQFSSWMDSSINKLTIYQYTTAKCSWVCFCWGLFLRPVRRPRVFGCPLNATGRLVQAATLLEITTRLVDDIGHGFSYILWQLECNRASLWAISAWKFQSSAVARHFVAPRHPPPSTPI